MKALAVGSGNTDIEQLKAYAEKSDCIIACDGGMHACRLAEITPNVILGDFDSAAADDRKYFENKNIEVHTFPTKKDYTDSELGIDFAIERGADTIYLLGMTGTRLDHTITNIHLLLLPLKKGINAVLADRTNTIRLTDGKIKIEGKPGDTVSLIPLTPTVSGITASGLEYPLDNAELNIAASLGVSNVMLSETAEIKVSSGVLMIMQSRD